jgi:endonuclease-3 related protein
MVNSPTLLHQMTKKLSAAFGPQKWWPAETPFEVMIGAVLTQNTAWSNVEKAIANLKENGPLEPRHLLCLHTETLEQLIKPAGYFRQKTKKLRGLLEWLVNNFNGEISNLKMEEPKRLRSELLSIWGIGPETADAILLYAMQVPIFVVDDYTMRMFKRHRLIEPSANYDEVQELAHSQMPIDTDYLNEAHALIVEVGKRHCHNHNPDCVHCPLKEFLPEG